MKNILRAMAVATLFLSQAGFSQTLKGQKVPQPFKVSRDGIEPMTPGAQLDSLNNLSQGTDKPVFADCPEGPHYVAFQLYYDLRGHSNTTIDWSVEIELNLMQANDTIWTKPLKISRASQTYIATVFHDEAITCTDNYHFIISQKNLAGNVPSNFIEFKVLLYPKDSFTFNPSAPVNLQYNYDAATNRTAVSWNYAGYGVLSFDLEWVFIHDSETFTGSTPQEAFNAKEPVRISTAGRQYDHLAFYPAGKLCYRIRAVGYNPQYPGHRIPGEWSYFDDSNAIISILNEETGKNWQSQTVFAEEGKSKTLMSYYDETLRVRQSLTNLNSDTLTLVAESLYDFEGRKSLDILPVPATDATLKFHSGFNNFLSTDPGVTSNTSPSQKKFHYDNQRAENSKMADTSGAGNYYSPSSDYSSVRKDMIPDGEGYVYSQTEYMRDGTGRPSKQSGVGKEFRTDGAHTTRYHYGEAAQEELVRLFGSNVGHSSHYKKNIVIDPNGQASVSYLDQEGRVIATALAGESPDNVEALDSLVHIKSEPLTIDVMRKNKIDGVVSKASQKISNISPTQFTFRYKINSLAAEIEKIGCQSCIFDLTLSLTDPDGDPVDLSGFSANQDDSIMYEWRGITASCPVSSATDSIEFQITLSELGAYTFTKTLIAREVSFEQMQQLAMQDATVQAQIDSLESYYVSDPTDCETCNNTCEASDQILDQTIIDVANLDCENILQQIIADIQTAYGDPSYEPTQDQVSTHVLYCKYQLCTQNVISDIFDRRLARIQSWAEADSIYSNVLESDPFFNDAGLSGFGHKFGMQIRLNTIDLGIVEYDNNGDGEPDGSKTYSGTISQVTDPANTSYYIDANGKPDATGSHILYLDLMSKRSGMTESAYQTELSRQRWTMYRTFYLEAKRKTKLDIYKGADPICSPVIDELKTTEELSKIDTEQEITEWAAQNQALGYDSLSDEAIALSFESIKNACNTSISPENSMAISDNLKAYFQNDPRNIFRMIQTEDLATDDNLAQIQTILNAYSCALDSAAYVDILTCVKDTTVTVHRRLPMSSSLALSPITYDNEAPYDGQYGQLWLRMDSLYSHRFNSDVADQESPMLMSQPLMAMNLMSGSGVPSQSEYDALISLYTSTAGQSWSNRTGWIDLVAGPAQDVSGLFGVVLDNDGHVIEINLQGNNLTGPLPSAIGDLIYLQHLRLGRRESTNGATTTYSYNHLNGAIPSSIGNLEDLVTLDLARNNFSGVSIPAEITNLVSLEYLYLNDQPGKYSGGAIVGSIPNDIGNLTQLKELRLENNNLSGDLPSSIASLSNLEILNLENNSVGGNLPDFSNLGNLRTLNLLYNSVGGNIPTSIGAAHSLVYIYLTSNNLVGSIPSQLMNLSSLQELHLGDNQLTGPIPSNLGSLSSLRILDLSGTGLTGSNQIDGQIPTSISSLEKPVKLTTLFRSKLTTFSGPN